MYSVKRTSSYPNARHRERAASDDMSDTIGMTAEAKTTTTTKMITEKTPYTILSISCLLIFIVSATIYRSTSSRQSGRCGVPHDVMTAISTVVMRGIGDMDNRTQTATSNMNHFIRGLSCQSSSSILAHTVEEEGEQRWLLKVLEFMEEPLS